MFIYKCECELLCSVKFSDNTYYWLYKYKANIGIGFDKIHLSFFFVISPNTFYGKVNYNFELQVQYKCAQSL